MQKKTKFPENPESRRPSHKYCIGFSDDDDSQTTPEEYQLDVNEEIPHQELAVEINGMDRMLDSLRSRISAGGFRQAGKSPRNPKDHQEKLVMHENCFGFGDNKDSNSEPEDLLPDESEEEQGEHQDLPFEEMAEEIRAMNATLDRIQDRLPNDVLEEIAKLASSIEEEMGLESEDARWLILHGSKDPAIRALQINSRRLRCQLADLVRCSELGATRLVAMNRQTIRHSNQLRAYRKQYESVHSHHLTLQLEAGKCLMRYRHCQEVYSTWRELHQMGRKAHVAYDKILEITQPRGEFVELKKQALSEISEVHESCLDSSSCLANRVRDIGQALGIFSQRVSKMVPQEWKNYTGPPVVVKSTHWQGRYTYTLRFARGELFTIPIVVRPPAKTWYGRMQANLLRGRIAKTQGSVKRK